MGDDYVVLGEDFLVWMLFGFWKWGWVGKVDLEVIGLMIRVFMIWLFGLGSRWDCL